MQRRNFLRVVGGVSLTSLAPMPYVWGRNNPALSNAGVLLEASAFKNLGGWKLDTQHYQQMGGNYLLAHGMGKPVANATAQVKLPKAGNWNVWIRNRDWCPGHWKSPGRFRVHVDGKALKPVFGEAKEAWHWQNGGVVKVAKAGDIEVALEDLTGFDGRCDAIYFTQESQPALPNGDLVELSNWKDRLTGRADAKIEELDFDVVIVGGGMSGCGAALAAKAEGLNVALIQDRPVFGGNASDEIRVHTIGIPGKGNAIIKKIDTKHYPNGHADAIKDQEKREKTMAESGVERFAHHIAIGLEKNGDRIASVEAREVTTGIIRRFRAPNFIDATGDGWLGHWAGAEIRYGREAKSEFGEAWDKHGELWSPEKPDQRVLGTSVLWNSVRTNERSDFPEVPWAKPVAKDHEAINGEWYWEYSAPHLNQIDDAEQIRDHMLRAIYGSFANAKEHPKNATVELKWVAHVGGKRESRRIMGDYLYTMSDMTERRTFPDAVVEEVRELLLLPRVIPLDLEALLELLDRWRALSFAQLGLLGDLLPAALGDDLTVAHVLLAQRVVLRAWREGRQQRRDILILQVERFVQDLRELLVKQPGAFLLRDRLGGKDGLSPAHARSVSAQCVRGSLPASLGVVVVVVVARVDKDLFVAEVAHVARIPHQPLRQGRFDVRLELRHLRACLLVLLELLGER